MFLVYYYLISRALMGAYYLYLVIEEEEDLQAHELAILCYLSLWPLSGELALISVFANGLNPPTMRYDEQSNNETS